MSGAGFHYAEHWSSYWLGLKLIDVLQISIAADLICN